MATERELVSTLDRIEKEIPGFIAASLVDLDSGMTLAVKTSRTDFDLTAASAYNSEMVKTKLKIMKTLGLGGTLEDMLLTLSEQIHLIKLITQTTFLYIAVDRTQCNLAIVRTVVNRNATSFT